MPRLAERQAHYFKLKLKMRQFIQAYKDAYQLTYPQIHLQLEYIKMEVIYYV
jgi:hypothetical protein